MIYSLGKKNMGHHWDIKQLCLILTLKMHLCHFHEVQNYKRLVYGDRGLVGRSLIGKPTGNILDLGLGCGHISVFIHKNPSSCIDKFVCFIYIYRSKSHFKNA